MHLRVRPVGQSLTTSVTEACARGPGAATSVPRRRRTRRTLLARGGMRAGRSHKLLASHAIVRVHKSLPQRERLGTQWSYRYSWWVTVSTRVSVCTRVFVLVWMCARDYMERMKSYRPSYLQSKHKRNHHCVQLLQLSQLSIASCHPSRS